MLSDAKLQNYPTDFKRALADFEGEHPEFQSRAVINAFALLEAVAALPPAFIDPRNEFAVARARAAVRADAAYYDSAEFRASVR